MKVSPTKKIIVILGMTTKMPVAGNVWLVIQYMLGFQRLGYEPYYVEAHAGTPAMLMRHASDDSSALAADFIHQMLHRVDMGDRWAFHALHDDGECYGMSCAKLRDLYHSAELIINLHGGTIPRPEHAETGRLIYLETDPVELQIELYHQDENAIRFLEPHVAFFSWGENYGNADCRVPLPPRFTFKPTRAPVICDLWQNGSPTGGENFSTIGNWKQPFKAVTFQGEVYHWSKHYEFLKFIDLPKRTDQPFELALASYEPSDQQMLQEHGWSVHDAISFSTDLDAYRDYIRRSRGEFTVAKDQNIRLRSGWFSERSAQYLATGRPVITQDTGFSNILPTGQGLFAFTTMDDILAAVESINTDYDRHCRAAAELAQNFFSYEVVLRRLLEDVGI